MIREQIFWGNEHEASSAQTREWVWLLIC